MFNYQPRPPPPPPKQYGGYPPMQEQPNQTQGYPGYPPTFPSVPVYNTDPEISFAAEQDASKDYDQASQPQRHKTVKRIVLTEGKYVVDCPVPPKLLLNVPKRDDKEFTHMRYTACTCDPDHFQKDKYTLRHNDRQTELFIAITMYNEDEILFARTFHSVVKNITNLCSRDRSRIWGKDGWEKVVVCIISDGRKNISQHVLAYLAIIGVYQEGIARNQVNGRDVTAHIYEYTTQISISPKMKLKSANEGIVPIQVIFCLKEKQAKKINSHRWFFNAFGPILNPNVCVLLDVGTKPGGTSIYSLWKAFDLNVNIGGACGEIVAMKGKAGVNLLNPIVAAQNFEYKISNILDKPLESVFGYITVLPGAFSAYRYIALRDDNGKGPLASYFMGETLQHDNTGIFTANMYLAEDRILCFELVVKRRCAWLLHYVKSAYAETDVPDTVAELISQRRRWLNGSFFTGVYAICHIFSIWRSHHSFSRKILLHVEMIYQVFNLIFSWFALGNLYLAFYIFSNSLTRSEVAPWQNEKIGEIIFEALQYIYLSLLIIQIIFAMGNRPRDSQRAYTISIAFFAVLMLYLLFAAIWVTYKGISGKDLDTKFNITDFIRNQVTLWNIILSITLTYGIYFIASLMFFEPWHMFSSLAQYMLLVPFYINVLNVYAFCNIHDVSWGTKGDTSMKHDLGVVETTDKGEVEIEQVDVSETYEDASNKLLYHVEKVNVRQKGERQEGYYKSFRTSVVLAWLFSNAILVISIINSGDMVNSLIPLSTQIRSNYYMQFILWSVAGLTAFRFLGSCMYLLSRLLNGGL